MTKLKKYQRGGAFIKNQKKFNDSVSKNIRKKRLANPPKPATKINIGATTRVKPKPKINPDLKGRLRGYKHYKNTKDMSTDELIRSGKQKGMSPKNPLLPLKPSKDYRDSFKPRKYDKPKLIKGGSLRNPRKHR